MNLAELKEEVRDTWEDLQGTYADVVQPGPSCLLRFDLTAAQTEVKEGLDG